LERDEIAPRNHRAWYPEPRGVGRSGGGPHTMEEAITDLEGIREAVGVTTWIVVGHSDWIHRPHLWSGLAACSVPMHFIAAGDDIRPPWSLAQLAALVPHGRFSTVPDVPHNFWSTHPEVWTQTITDACTAS
jgi:pimeloyl-ACP methyl ester carboxylesterase